MSQWVIAIKRILLGVILKTIISEIRTPIEFLLQLYDCNFERIRTMPWIIQLFSRKFQDCICLDVKLPSRWHFSTRSPRLITSFLPFILISKLLRRHSAGNLWLSKFIAFGLANIPYFMKVFLCYTFLPASQWDRWLMIRSFFLSILDEPVLKLLAFCTYT